MAKNKNTEPTPANGSLAWWISGGLLVVLVVGIIVGVVIWPRDTSAVPDNTTPPTAPATTDEPAAKAGTACKATNVDTTLPDEAPETTWQTHPSEMLVPTSEKYGPTVQDGNLWSCFERSPTGAVFAGANLTAALSMSEADAAISGPGRDTALEENASASNDYERPVIEGFRVLAADESTATVEYWASSQGQTYSMGLDLVWDENAEDWRLNLETPGDHPRVGVLEDTAPYVRWR
jgi:hypothetical protein